MILQPDYVSILSNLNPRRPLDIDGALFDPNDVGAVVEIDGERLHHASCLSPLADPSLSHIGCRVKSPIAHPEQVAARLAAIALERQIYPIFLSYVADCDMQRFGFRVEQLDGLSQEAQQLYEAQLTQFWGLAIVLDASELGQLQ